MCVGEEGGSYFVRVVQLQAFKYEPPAGPKTFSRSYTRWCRVGLERFDERPLARLKSPVLTAQTTRPLQRNGRVASFGAHRICRVRIRLRASRCRVRKMFGINIIIIFIFIITKDVCHYV